MNNTFELFGLTIHWYGVILTFAMVMALCLFVYLGSKRKVDSDFALSMFLFAIIFAIFGARLFYVLPRAEYWESWAGFGQAFNITEGGLTIVGGVPVGALGILICCKIYHKSPARILDIVVPALLLGQIIGRWGNYVNQELYGLVITDPQWQFFPFAVFIERDGLWHCASFFYEMCLNAIGLGIALYLFFHFKDRLKPGFLSVCYVIWYGFVRGTLEFVKYDPLMWGSVRAIQLICYLCAAVGIVVLVLLQTGKIKFETEKMYMKHFNIVLEPPPYVENEE